LDPNSPEAQAEVTRRHKAAATTVLGLIVATILLSIVAFLGQPYFREQPNNPPLNMAVYILFLIFGLGSIVWRRTKFAAARLQDIARLSGVTGLVRTLEKTTLQLALMATAIVVLGFVTTLMTGTEDYTYRGGAIALVVLVFSYPKKSLWLRAVDRFTNTELSPEPPPDPEAL
jgi:hypothetical protein